MADGFWTDERVAKLRLMVAEGHSCSVIGNALGNTRNAVIGKVSRLKLPRPATQAGKNMLSAFNMRRAIKRGAAEGGFGTVRKLRDGKSQLQRIKDMVVRGVPADAICDDIGINRRHLAGYVSKLNVDAEIHDPELDVAAKALLELEAGECKWPVGHPSEKDFGFCAKPSLLGRPYCDGHMKRAYQPPDQPRRKFTPFPPSKVREREDA